MDLTVVGVSHRTAPLAAREALAVVPPAAALSALRQAGWSEAVVVSTCNRFELYLAGATAGAEALALLDRLAGRAVSPHAYLRSGREALRHLFEVSAGLDSLVVGETEILGQVKSSYEAALGLGMTGKITNVLFQRALYVGKLVRSTTGIGVGQTSVASAAVQLAESIFGGLSESRVLVLGAGAMAELAGRHFLSKKVAALSIANRTSGRAEELAARLGRASTVSWDRLLESVAQADVVLCSTGSERPVLSRDAVSGILPRRAGRSLFLIDIAMPRDVEESVHELERVYLYRLEDLEAIVAGNLRNRGGEVDKARGIVLAKSEELAAWAESVAAGREMSLRHSPLEMA